MKKFAILIVFLVMALSSMAQSLTTKVALGAGRYSECYQNDSISVNFFASESTITIFVTNLLDERINIEWENFRWDGSHIAFNNDSRISMRNPKVDEVVVGKESCYRTLIRKDDVLSNYVASWYKRKAKTNDGATSTEIILPIRYSSGKTKDYKITIVVTKN